MAWDLEEALAYYQKMGVPGDQSELIGLLREVQQENGGSIPQWAVEKICSAYNIKPGLILALVKRIPSLRLGEGHLLEVCAGPNCGKQREIAAFADKLTGNVTVKYVPCMRLCGKGPNVRWDGTLHHGVTVEKLRELIGE